MTASARKPETRAEGLGEIIRAHRLYLGLSQRAMAVQLNKARRDYQRIETGADACPAGLLSTVEALTDKFDSQVDSVMAYARGGETQLIVDPDNEWDRSVAGRAAVLAAVPDNKTPPIILVVMDVAERGAPPGDVSEAEQRRLGIFSAGDQRQRGA